MPRQKYMNNIMYLFKRDTTDNTPDYEQEGIPFYCNIENVKKSSFNPMANTYKSEATEVAKTTTQIQFGIDDIISKKPAPMNDANEADFSTIIDINEKPYLEKGNKYRTVEYKEYWLTLS